MPKRVSSDNKYTQMQQNVYDHCASMWSVNERDHVVGTFDAHNNWKDYDDYLFRDVEKPLNECTVLDFGCGPGRNIVKFNSLFNRIDGADISQKNIDNAKIWIESNGCKEGQLYKNNGVDLSDIASEIYDIVMSTICFQHICVYEIRKNYIKEFNRVLKLDGTLTLQMGFGGKPAGYNTSEYYENNYDAIGTNSFCDVTITDVSVLEKDLKELGFENFKYYIRQVGPGDSHRNWIFFSAQKKKIVQ